MRDLREIKQQYLVGLINGKEYKEAFNAQRKKQQVPGSNIVVLGIDYRLTGDK